MNYAMTAAAALIFLLASTAALADAGDRVERRLDNRGDRIEQRYDSRGDRAERRFDRASDRASAAGRDRAANRLERQGDRVALRAQHALEHAGKSVSTVIS